MQRYAVSKEQWLRCQGSEDHVTRISKAPRMLTMPKGAGWKTSIVARVSVMSMVSWVSRMFEGVLDEKGGHDHVFYVDPEPWR